MQAINIAHANFSTPIENGISALTAPIQSRAATLPLTGKIKELAIATIKAGNVDLLQILIGQCPVPSAEECEAHFEEAKRIYQEELVHRTPVYLSEDRDNLLNYIKTGEELFDTEGHFIGIKLKLPTEFAALFTDETSSDDNDQEVIIHSIEEVKIALKALKASFPERATELFDGIAATNYKYFGNPKSEIIEEKRRGVETRAWYLKQVDNYLKEIDVEPADRVITRKISIKEFAELLQKERVEPDLKRYTSQFIADMEARLEKQEKMQKRGDKIKNRFEPLIIAHNKYPNDSRYALPLELPISSQGKMVFEVDQVAPLFDEALHINDSIDNEGNTLLHHAIYAAKPEVISLLVAKGADIHRKDALGLSPVQLAIAANRYDLVLLLDPTQASPEARHYHELNQKVEKFMKQALPALQKAAEAYQPGWFASSERKKAKLRLVKEFESFAVHKNIEFTFKRLAMHIEVLFNMIKDMAKDAVRGCFGRSQLFDTMEKILKDFMPVDELSKLVKLVNEQVQDYQSVLQAKYTLPEGTASASIEGTELISEPSPVLVTTTSKLEASAMPDSVRSTATTFFGVTVYGSPASTVSMMPASPLMPLILDRGLTHRVVQEKSCMVTPLDTDSIRSSVSFSEDSELTPSAAPIFEVQKTKRAAQVYAVSKTLFNAVAEEYPRAIGPVR